jgi:ubiquitin-activating enzyme E1 C
VRVIIPTITPCFECYFDQIPRKVDVSLDEIFNHPRTPAHIVECAIYEFGNKIGFFFFFFVSNITTEGKKPDGNNPEDVQAVYELAKKRAERFGIEGVDFLFTLNVIKPEIKNLPRTISCVPNIVCNEVLKLALQLFTMKNYLQYSGSEV